MGNKTVPATPMAQEPRYLIGEMIRFRIRGHTFWLHVLDREWKNGKYKYLLGRTEETYHVQDAGWFGEEVIKKYEDRIP